MRRRWTTVDSDGVALAVETTAWGDRAAASPIVMTHATGFCKEVLHPTIDELRHRLAAARISSFDLRSHGTSQRGGQLRNWWPLASDALAITGGEHGLIGMGHSCGGAALVYAELLAPGTFAGLVLVEPIIFPEDDDELAEEALVRSAQRRKPGFPSREEALENFAGKPAFAGWVPAALAAYVDNGLIPDGAEFRLACVPNDEATMYAVSRVDSGWPQLHQIRCPVTIVTGEHSDSHPASVVEALAAQFSAAGVETVRVAGATHFVPMERPGAVAAAVVDMLGISGDGARPD